MIPGWGPQTRTQTLILHVNKYRVQFTLLGGTNWQCCGSGISKAGGWETAGLFVLMLGTWETQASLKDEGFEHEWRKQCSYRGLPPAKTPNCHRRAAIAAVPLGVPCSFTLTHAQQCNTHRSPKQAFQVLDFRLKIYISCVINTSHSSSGNRSQCVFISQT